MLSHRVPAALFHLAGEPSSTRLPQSRALARGGADTHSLHLHRAGQAETEEERAEWVAAIQGVIAALLMLTPEDHATLAEVAAGGAADVSPERASLEVRAHFTARTAHD